MNAFTFIAGTFCRTAKSKTIEFAFAKKQQTFATCFASMVKTVALLPTAERGIIDETKVLSFRESETFR